ncbi:MAG: translation initiation factor IF-2 [Sedimentisphaerales bacterium]|nr:translation initiation factor IF-2 [Sedimentisphaerales bacterium]
MTVTRVYILAKELGVKSSAIVKKCQDEGLDVENHMSAISAGLAATVREWFTEGENVTTVEIAEKVDLDRVRIKKKPERKPPAKAEKGQQAEQVEASQEPVQVAAEPAVVAEADRGEQKSAAARTIEIEQARLKPDVVIEQQPLPPEKIIKEPKKLEPVPILPAGPMLEKPEPAQLSGPRVVRVEAPEPLRRPKQKYRYDAPVTEPLMYSVDEPEGMTLMPGRERKHEHRHRKDKSHVRRVTEVGSDVIQRPKVRGKWRQRDIEERRARLDAASSEVIRLRPVRKIATKADREAAVAPVKPKKVTVSEPITIKELSSVLAVKSADIISVLMKQDVMATANQTINNDVAELVALEFDTELVIEHKSSLEEQILIEFEKRERKNLKKRAVIAAMLGHVDHGKTSLLDKIRSTHVTADEAGGITQHIGASQVTWDGKMVTFIDTPGHEAFTAMRARGANMTDVVVLTVAADDGVMPQTIEAIAHSRAAGVPIIVALNKIDLPGCDINRIYSQLAEHNLAPAEWGGQTEVVKTSAITGEGIHDLLECLDYVAELLDLKADDTISATGWVVEAKLSSQEGPVATLLIKEGQLNKGDLVLAGCACGRVKMMKNSQGKVIKTAASSMPVEIIGLGDVPQAGDMFYCLDDINKAKLAAEENKTRSRESTLIQRSRITLDNLFSQIEAGNVKELNLIIRADVQGSVDVLTKYLSELSTNEVKIKILHAATGGITEGDVLLAEASNAIIIGFSVVPEEHASKIADSRGVEIRLYNIIYRITEDLQKSMAGMLEPEEQEKNLGRAVVRAAFKISKVGTVAGCYVTSGMVTKNARARLIRDNIVIRDNLTIESLKHFKNDVREAKTSMECGIKIAGFDDIKVDDVFDFYEIVKVARTL